MLWFMGNRHYTNYESCPTKNDTSLHETCEWQHVKVVFHHVQIDEKYNKYKNERCVDYAG